MDGGGRKNVGNIFENGHGCTAARQDVQFQPPSRDEVFRCDNKPKCRSHAPSISPKITQNRRMIDDFRRKNRCLEHRRLTHKRYRTGAVKTPSSNIYEDLIFALMAF
jgi:hypothetical protein